MHAPSDTVTRPTLHMPHVALWLYICPSDIIAILINKLYLSQKPLNMNTLTCRCSRSFKKYLNITIIQKTNVLTATPHCVSIMPNTYAEGTGHISLTRTEHLCDTHRTQCSFDNIYCHTFTIHPLTHHLNAQLTSTSVFMRLHTTMDQPVLSHHGSDTHSL
ncbi:hypothetical protein NP493_312g00024 [Ridgeia piscesae]|uniref:Uncharacterized protein n=1 Tax=Ridgeia piscesae TaxID=27915 RepID=A0AAD9L742_RIDPI|nr:hypothetical protein NP493_312g00024 [Ridgeia piscesae]